MAQPDLSKIVSIIMENPKLVEEIREMVSRSEGADTSEEKSPDVTQENTADEASANSPEPTYQGTSRMGSQTSRRNELLRAMQPYVSKERSKAIESMITIADLLLAFKEK